MDCCLVCRKWSEKKTRFENRVLYISIISIMPKLINLSKISNESEVPAFRVPGWLKPKQIGALMCGAVSDTEDESSDHEEHLPPPEKLD